MIIIGLDPGSYHFGYGVIETRPRAVSCLCMGSVDLPVKTELPLRLLTIYNRLREIFRQYTPECVGLESVFFHKNVKSMSVLAQSRAMGILLSAEFNSSLIEVSPRKIKQSVTGNGNAHKEQVQVMVRKILKLEESGFDLNASDALATALCIENHLKATFLTKTNTSISAGILKRQSSKWTLQAIKKSGLRHRS